MILIGIGAKVMEEKSILSSNWCWWILLLAAILLLVIRYYALCFFEVSTKSAELPKLEIAATENATEKLSKKIKEAQRQSEKLPEVLKNAKTNKVTAIAGVSNNDIADRWNAHLGNYRESRTASQGLLAD